MQTRPPYTCSIRYPQPDAHRSSDGGKLVTRPRLQEFVDGNAQFTVRGPGLHHQCPATLNRDPANSRKVLRSREQHGHVSHRDGVPCRQPAVGSFPKQRPLIDRVAVRDREWRPGDLAFARQSACAEALALLAGQFAAIKKRAGTLHKGLRVIRLKDVSPKNHARRGKN